MASNTRARNLEIAAAARALLVAREVDATEVVLIKTLAPAIVEQTGCHVDTARRHLARAVRLMRGEMSAAWGGPRDGAGRPQKKR